MNISVFEVVAWVPVKGTDNTLEQSTTLVSAETMSQVWDYIKSNKIDETADIESIRCLGVLSCSLVSPSPSED